MIYKEKEFTNLSGLNGLSDEMIKNHFTLYKGYVTNANKIKEELTKAVPGSAIYNELKRRFGWEWNGVRMHELYFENLVSNSEQINQDSELYKKIVAQFGTFENWLSDFKTTGLMRGIGWAVLVYDPLSGELINHWVGEHDLGQLSEQKVILVMDVWEHAYITDYGIKRVDYIESFIKNINWSVVEKRFA